MWSQTDPTGGVYVDCSELEGEKKVRRWIRGSGMKTGANVRNSTGIGSNFLFGSKQDWRVTIAHSIRCVGVVYRTEMGNQPTGAVFEEKGVCFSFQTILNWC